MNNCSTNHLYIMSFVAGADSGLAFLSAKSPDEAMSLLRNTGRYNGTPDTYKAIQIRDIGMATTIRSELLLESYVNALVAFDAIYNAVKIYTGPQGVPGLSAYQVAREHGYLGSEEEWLADLKGDKGDKGDSLHFGSVTADVTGSTGDPSVDIDVNGPDTAKDVHFTFNNIKGNTGVSIASIVQTSTATEDGGENVITVTLDDGTESTFNVRNGHAGVTEVGASVDSLPGDPTVVTNLEGGVLTLSFYGLRGVQGNPGQNDTTMVIVSELPDIEDADFDKIYLVFDENTGEYDRYFLQTNGTTTSWVQAGTTSINLEDYQRKDEEVWLTQEAFEALSVKDINVTYNVYEDQDAI